MIYPRDKARTLTAICTVTSLQVSDLTYVCGTIQWYHIYTTFRDSLSVD
jgi:hypothetical protein